MYRVIICFFLVTSLSCKTEVKNVANTVETDVATYGYYSAYYVFVSDDQPENPLIVPIDINWFSTIDGFEAEYKAWYGTAKSWPIAYYKNEFKSDSNKFPKETFHHKNYKTFEFSKSKELLSVLLDTIQIELHIPNKEKAWVLPDFETDFPTSAIKSSCRVNGEIRKGWLLYERVRIAKNTDFKGFEAFYWMPIVVDNSLFLFTQHRDKQTAIKWSEVNKTVSAENVNNFELVVKETKSDSISGRVDVPKKIAINVADWNLNLEMMSTGEQVGYGEPYPKGLALFRQSLLEFESQSQQTGHGMMELILADN